MSNICPKCSLSCPSSQTECDCGYSLVSKEKLENPKGKFYFWNLKGLLKTLSARELTPWEEKSYYIFFIAPFLFNSILSTSKNQASERTNSFGFLPVIGWLIGLLIFYVYLTILYDANGKNAGKNFLGRYISISAVVNFRLILMMIPFILLIALQPFNLEGKVSWTFIIAGAAIFCLVIYSIFAVYSSMRELGKNSKLK